MDLRGWFWPLYGGLWVVKSEYTKEYTSAMCVNEFLCARIRGHDGFLARVLLCVHGGWRPVGAMSRRGFTAQNRPASSRGLFRPRYSAWKEGYYTNIFFISQFTLSSNGLKASFSWHYEMYASRITYKLNEANLDRASSGKFSDILWQ